MHTEKGWGRSRDSSSTNQMFYGSLLKLVVSSPLVDAVPSKTLHLTKRGFNCCAHNLLIIKFTDLDRPMVYDQLNHRPISKVLFLAQIPRPLYSAIRVVSSHQVSGSKDTSRQRLKAFVTFQPSHILHLG